MPGGAKEVASGVAEVPAASVSVPSAPAASVSVSTRKVRHGPTVGALNAESPKRTF